MAWQDVASYYTEPDDEPPPGRTLPEHPKARQRFMQETANGLWTVYDWVPEGCACLGRHRDAHGCPLPDPACTVCKGTGDGGPVPEVVATELLESDARLLTFGGELVRVCGLLSVALGRIPYEVFDALPDAATNGFRKALANVMG